MKAGRRKTKKVGHPKKPRVARLSQFLGADLQKQLEQQTRELAEARRHLTEALEQQTATSEVLRVISRSPTDLVSVLDTVSANASRLCGASDAAILLVDGAYLRPAAHHGRVLPAAEARPLRRDGVAGRAVIDRETIHVLDVLAADEFPLGQPLAKADRSRTILATPLMREEVALGAILVRRTEARLFSDKQVALLKTFADQAVIAIENTRLLNELRESLQQQTATSEVLQVISSSPGELEPVFQAMLENATRICEAKFGSMVLYDGDVFRRVALHDAPEAFAAL